MNLQGDVDMPGLRRALKQIIAARAYTAKLLDTIPATAWYWLPRVG